MDTQNAYSRDEAEQRGHGRISFNERGPNDTQQEKHYLEFLSWITDGGLRYAFAKYNHLPDTDTFYRSTVPTEKIREVVIVGAGMAGLSSAYELAQVGHKVTILEARDRVGGRVHTYRDFEDGIHCEAGAMRIPLQHFLVAHYVDHFGLRTETFRNSNPNTYLHMHSHTFRNSDWQASNREYCDRLWPGWDANLPYGHGINGILDLYNRTMAPVIAEITPESSEHDWQEWIRKWSKWTMSEFLRSDCNQEGLQEKFRPWPEAAIKAYVESTYSNRMEGDVPLLIRHMVEKNTDYPVYGLSGGMDTLPKSFMGKNEKGWNTNVELQNNVIYDAVVEKIETINGLQGHKRVRVIYRHSVSGITGVHEADAAILTVPLPVLRNINLPLPDDKLTVLGDIKTFNATKILLQCRSRFWEKDQGVGGFTQTTLPIGQIHYYNSEKLNQSGSQRGILMIYAWQEDADALGDMEEDKAIEEAVEQISQIHPDIKTEFQCGKVHVWYKEPFSQCAYASLGNIDYVERLKALTTPTIGLPLYLAGEALSWARGWIQGAIFSGLMAAYCIQSSAENGSIVSPITMMK